MSWAALDETFTQAAKVFTEAIDFFAEEARAVGSQTEEP